MISVIVPVLNEEARLHRQLRALSQQGFGELLVVDGGSTDRSPEIARSFPELRLLSAPRGRASQMNAGAAAARGEILLFLHADTTLPQRAAAHIEAALSSPEVIFGAFKLRTVRDEGPTPPWLRLADLRSRYSRLPYGDQAIFVRKEAFFAVGAYPDQPLMEDLELSRRLSALGRYARAPAEVCASSRRLDNNLIGTTLFLNIAPTLYRLGVPPDRLARWYREVR